MQGTKELHPKMLYQVYLQDLVSADNFYRLVDKSINFRFLYQSTKQYYGQEGQESIDPVVESITPLPQICNPCKKTSVTLIQNIRDFFWMAKSPDFEY